MYDTLGHDMGDLLLIEISSRLKKTLREIDTDDSRCLTIRSDNAMLAFADALGEDEKRWFVYLIKQELLKR